jgi:hypothetical protein
MENEKDNLESTVKFVDSIAKTLDGLKDKFNLLLFESEAKNTKPDLILQNWVDQSLIVIKEKYEEIFQLKYSPENFDSALKVWITKYKDNNEFILNSKVLFKNLQIIRNTIKTKLTVSDSLSYVNLTDSLINKASKNK